MNMRDYSTLHLDTNSSKGTALLSLFLHFTVTVEWSIGYRLGVHVQLIYRLLIDCSICCLKSSEQYFSYDENKYSNERSCRWKGNSGMGLWVDI